MSRTLLTVICLTIFAGCGESKQVVALKAKVAELQAELSGLQPLMRQATEQLRISTQQLNELKAASALRASRHCTTKLKDFIKHFEVPANGGFEFKVGGPTKDGSTMKGDCPKRFTIITADQNADGFITAATIAVVLPNVASEDLHAAIGEVILDFGRTIDSRINANEFFEFFIAAGSIKAGDVGVTRPFADGELDAFAFHQMVNDQSVIAVTVVQNRE